MVDTCQQLAYMDDDLGGAPEPEPLDMSPYSYSDVERGLQAPATGPQPVVGGKVELRSLVQRWVAVAPAASAPIPSVGPRAPAFKTYKNNVRQKSRS